jgi:uncharacterized OB-fold protein
MDDAKPVPFDTPEERPYWKAAARGELALQHCPRCARFVHPPRPGCPFCGGEEAAWVVLGSRITGVVYSFVTVHRAFDPSFAGDVPYVVALCDVDQAEGVRILANVPGQEADVAIGRRVVMAWEERGNGSVVPQWQLDI